MSTLHQRQMMNDDEVKALGAWVVWIFDEDADVVGLYLMDEETPATVAAAPLGRMIGWHSTRSHVFGDPWIMLDRCLALPRVTT